MRGGVRRGAGAYLFGLERVVRCLDGHVLVAGNLDPVCDDAFGVALVVEGVGDGLALRVGDLGRLAACQLRLPDEKDVADGRTGGRTVKPAEEAQMALPAASQMTALSMLPGPTRLQRVNKGPIRGLVTGTWCRCMLEVASVLHRARGDVRCSPCQDMMAGLCGRRELVEG